MSDSPFVVFVSALLSGGLVLTHWRLRGATLFWCLRAAQTSNIWRSTCVTCLIFCSYFILLAARFVFTPPLQELQILLSSLLQQVEEIQGEINFNVYKKQSGVSGILFFEMVLSLNSDFFLGIAV